MKGYRSLGILFFVSLAPAYSTTFTAHPYFNLYRATCDKQPEAVCIFAHGLGATHKQAINLFAHVIGHNFNGTLSYNHHWIFQGPIALFDFPDAKNDNDDFHRDNVNLGQKPDMERLDYALKKTVEQSNGCSKFLLTGPSRGAATVINYVATYPITHHIALILESPFDTLYSIIKHLLRRFRVWWLPFSSKVALWLAHCYFPALDIKGIFPLEVADKIPIDTPILLVHSKKDKNNTH